MSNYEPWEAEWYDALKFHEAWYFLNLTTFRKMPMCDWLHDDPDGKFRNYPSRKHQLGNDVVRHFKEAFTDRFAETYGRSFLEYHAPVRPVRDTSIPVPGPVVCVRCGRGPTTMVEWGEVEGVRPRKLERDHKVALKYGGKDVSENLQWFCYVCHKFKTAEEEILHTLEGLTIPWRVRMWQHRLKVLRERNPPGKETYSWYINDPSTDYKLFYQRPSKKTFSQHELPREQLTLLEDES